MSEDQIIEQWKSSSEEALSRCFDMASIGYEYIELDCEYYSEEPYGPGYGFFGGTVKFIDENPSIVDVFSGDIDNFNLSCSFNESFIDPSTQNELKSIMERTLDDFIQATE